jgi:hypothetical protein
MLSKLRYIGCFSVIGILPKFFDVPVYLRYFIFLVIFIFLDDVYKLIYKKDDQK